MQVNIDELIENLNTQQHIQVKFMTKAGIVRTMDCTRLTTVSGADNIKLNGPSIIAVYDLLIGQWRAFRKDSVVAWAVVDHRPSLFTVTGQKYAL